MKRVVVADASPIIALLSIGHLALLERLYGTVLLTREVRDEIDGEVPAWMSVVDGGPALPAQHYGVKLDPGELSAIRYAEVNRVDLLLMDERRGRAVCNRLALAVVGTVGIVQEARRAGLVPSIRPIIEGLVADGLYLSQTVIERALAEVGE